MTRDEMDQALRRVSRIDREVEMLDRIDSFVRNGARCRVSIAMEVAVEENDGDSTQTHWRPGGHVSIPAPRVEHLTAAARAPLAIERGKLMETLRKHGVCDEGEGQG
jgi:hypothetical protein